MAHEQTFTGSIPSSNPSLNLYIRIKETMFVPFASLDSLGTFSLTSQTFYFLVEDFSPTFL